MTGTIGAIQLADIINWAHFFYTWNVKENSQEADKLKKEALHFLESNADRISVRYAIETFPVTHDKDDLLVECSNNRTVRIPFLRQQTVNKDGYCLCISDFIGKKVTMFATTVVNTMHHDDDPYTSLLLQTLSDRLAEAAAENIAPGIRPAVGYPSIPDLSINFLIGQLLDFSKIGITLTENGMMIPHSSVSGIKLDHEKAQYFSIGEISEEQRIDYAERRGYTLTQMRKYI